MNTYSDLFRVMNLAYSLLQIPAPTKNEIKDAKKAVARLEQLWRQLKISETPKAYILYILVELIPTFSIFFNIYQYMSTNLTTADSEIKS